VDRNSQANGSSHRAGPGRKRFTPADWFALGTGTWREINKRYPDISETAETKKAFGNGTAKMK
jgi:hypothetical protein